jgi:RNA ligase
MNNYQKLLYQDLMLLAGDDNAFYFIDRLFNGRVFRVFNYRLASYTDFLKPNAMESRGIMFEMIDGNPLSLISLPPKKFFNWNENPLTTNIDFTKTRSIMDKLDGSIMTTYKLSKDAIYLKSKTSLESDQANAANKFLNLCENSALLEFLMHMELNGYSVSMEFTDPQFRIVLPYQAPNLTVFSARRLIDGTEYPYHLLQADMNKFGCAHNLVKCHFNDIGLCEIESFINNIPNMKDIEGYVVNVGGTNVKIKCNWYLSLHKTKDSINTPSKLFEVIINERSDDLRSLFIDDQYSSNLITEMEEKIIPEYNRIIYLVEKFHQMYKDVDRKTYAIAAKEQYPQLMSLCMNLYLGKTNDYQDFAIKNMTDIFGISNVNKLEKSIGE